MRQKAPEIPVREEDQNDPDMKNALELLRAGRDAEAARFLLLSSNNGNPSAQYSLGLLYATGNGVPEDFAMAVEYFSKAAEQDIAAAQNDLGMCYYDGTGTAKNDKLAAYWFGRAAKLGMTEAQLRLGNMYMSGSGVEKT